jgi:hypothetical protein
MECFQTVASAHAEQSLAEAETKHVCYELTRNFSERIAQVKPRPEEQV